MLHLPSTEKWQDILSLSGFGVLGAILLIELAGEWFIAGFGVPADLFELPAQLAEVQPVEALKALVCTGLLAFSPLLLKCLLLLLTLLLQGISWPRLTVVWPRVAAPLKPRRILHQAHGCRAPPLYS